ncbi:Insect cuticle protein [Trinorchestia longiramus]|nr:Insect cuticle protein [Trinorchestia longiramus]
MMGWCSWIVFAACAVTIQSFPHPDEYQIPAIPFGKRAQYYVLHDDGDFKYGYDTGVGGYESAVKMGSGDLTGFFGFNNALGENVRVDYTAGAGGFQPRGDHLPVAPQDTAFRSASGASSLSSTGHSASVPQFSTRGQQAPAGGYSSSVSSATQGQGRPNEEANIKLQANIDGSYSFSYDNSDSSRLESGDADNNVVGQFSFVADDGQNRQIRYKAGSATGFIAEGDGIPEAPAAPAVPSLHSAVGPAATAPNVASVRQGYSYSAPDQPAVSTLYNAPDNTLSASVQNQPRGDASYSFNYKTDDSARDESSDADLNVKGSYSFVGDDGQSRRVNYIAGSSTGFVATGDHLPVAPEASDPTSLASPVQYSAPARSPPIASSHSQIQGPQTSRDASYQFNYQTGDSSRSESADADLNVRGDFSFVADDGQRRTVSYVAGSGTGFVAEGSHLPVAPEVPAVPVHTAQPTTYQSPAVYSGSQTGQQVGANIASTRNTDGSYSFSYQNADSSRTESADSSNNVVGEYSFIADDGENRHIRYQAGSATGFVADGSSIPTSPEFKTASHSPSTFSGSQTPIRSDVGTASTAIEYSAPSSATGQSRGDASYAFSYNTGDSSRNEESDSDLNVRGSFSFVADDGVNRQVNYIAGSGTGFVAEGEHLPKSPEATVAGTGTTRSQVLVKSAPSVPSASTFGSSVGTYSSNQEIANVRSSQGTDGGYSFSYTNPDSSRSESGDADNNVVGEFSFVADDGQNRQVRYRAGAATGFIAEGDGIPEVPEVSATSTVHTAGSDAFKAQGYSYSAPVAPSVSTFSAPSSTATVRGGSNYAQTGGARGDASYSFKYDAGDSAREENADTDLNVRGQYSFVADDGIRRNVNYRAGSATGFVAEGDHLPVAPELPSSVLVPSTRTSAGYSGSAANVRSGTKTEFKSATQSGSEGQIIGNVLLHQYPPTGSKAGYSFVEI